MIKQKPRSSKTVTAPARTTKKVAAPAPVSKSRALVTQPRKDLSTNVIDFAADSHMGMEGMTQQDYAIPRLAILQDLSPQVQKRDERHIEGAEPGDICDTVANVLYDGDEGIIVIPVSYRRAFTEWVPRTKGGGFVQDWSPTTPESAKSLQDFLATCDRGDKGEITTPKGNEMKVSGEYFVFLVDPATGDFQPFVLNMGGAQMKKSRRWNTIMNQLKIEHNGERINPAMFYRSYKLTTIPEKNDQGSWFGWAIGPGEFTIELPNGENTYIEAKEFRLSIASGRVSVAQPVQEDIGTSSVAQTDEVPF